MNYSAIARTVAHAAHGAAGQTYNDQPYHVGHLAEVVGILEEYNFHQEYVGVVQVGWLHDILEDTQLTSNDLRDMRFHIEVVRAVMFCTDQPGHNRKVRKTNTYQVTRQDIDRHGGSLWLRMGLAAKWADRVANLRNAVASNSNSNSNSGLLKMYRREWEDFRNAYMPPWLGGPDMQLINLWNPIVAEYDRLIGGPA
jgi:(p)ppGpp synthase/HD superfamily hydrolase